MQQGSPCAALLLCWQLLASRAWLPALGTPRCARFWPAGRLAVCTCLVHWAHCAEHFSGPLSALHLCCLLTALADCRSSTVRTLLARSSLSPLALCTLARSGYHSLRAWCCMGLMWRTDGCRQQRRSPSMYIRAAPLFPLLCPCRCALAHCAHALALPFECQSPQMLCSGTAACRSVSIVCKHVTAGVATRNT
jgi:hypothetical protein